MFMRFVTNIFLSFVLYLAITACNNQTSTTDKQNSNSSYTSTDSLNVPRGLDVEPILNRTDSLQILYFDDPYGDSLRYTRYFSYLSVADSSVVKTIIREFDTRSHETNMVKKQCRSEGKIIVYAGAEPVKTLYFSTGAIDQCKAYIYFIKDGAFYYFNLSPETVSVLNELKTESKKP